MDKEFQAIYNFPTFIFLQSKYNNKEVPFYVTGH